ncbi:nuclear transport factor 2 family protein [Nonomuraea sp. 3N208]|uniref:nuclear transport factor 2 family protein n=1 Tax=Nonomuraea sp. 3N208 TaxID=3457421 RepID=UPI003FD266FF
MSDLPALERRIAVLEARQEIRDLQHKYGYYLDKCHYREVAALFSDDGEAYFCGGLYKGRAGIDRLFIERFGGKYGTVAHNGPVHGFLLDHPQFQDVVSVAPDLRTARGRFRCFMQAGLHESARGTFPGKVSYEQWWEGGIYENTYVREDEVWKFLRLEYRPIWHGDFDKGWARTQPMTWIIPTRTFPEDPLGPDQIVGDFDLFPAADTVPFHYPHPVTGQEWDPAAGKAL